MMLSQVAKRALPARNGAFTVADLQFALGWSRVAPGLGGWQVEVTQISSGEMVDVTPPGAENPVFCILPRQDYVQIIRERPIDMGGGQVNVACVGSLREAVLLLCPLGDTQVAEVSQQVEQHLAAEGTVWGVAA